MQYCGTYMQINKAFLLIICTTSNVMFSTIPSKDQSSMMDSLLKGHSVTHEHFTVLNKTSQNASTVSHFFIS